MRLDDTQIERYSRQLVLAEIGPRGQARLAAARVAIAGVGAAVEPVVAYLAAAGVGTLAVPAALRALVDPLQPDVVLVPLETHAAAARADATAAYDAALVTGATLAAPPAARRTFWIADGRAAELPPCRECAASVLGESPAADEIVVPLRDTLLGTIVATEIVKALLDLGTPLRGRVLTYDAGQAALTTSSVAARPGCRCMR